MVGLGLSGVRSKKKSLSVSMRKGLWETTTHVSSKHTPGDAPVRKFLCLCLSIKLRLMSQRTDEKFKQEDARESLEQHLSRQ